MSHKYPSESYEIDLCIIAFTYKMICLPLLIAAFYQCLIREIETGAVKLFSVTFYVEDVFRVWLNY